MVEQITSIFVVRWDIVFEWLEPFPVSVTCSYETVSVDKRGWLKRVKYSLPDLVESAHDVEIFRVVTFLSFFNGILLLVFNEYPFGWLNLCRSW